MAHLTYLRRSPFKLNDVGLAGLMVAASLKEAGATFCLEISNDSSVQEPVKLEISTAGHGNYLGAK